jgi:glycosyltransferase involved in cell wall biosynthesis
MRILMLNHLYPPFAAGGAEKATATLAEAMVRAGHSVAVTTLTSERSESVAEENGVRVYRVPLDNLFWPFIPDNKHSVLAKLAWHLIDIYNWKAARRFRRILDVERPDVLHTHVITGFSPAVWRVAKQRSVRVVHTLHDYELICGRSALFREGHACEQQCRECKLLTFRTKSDCQYVDHVVSVSEFVLATHRRFDRFGSTADSVIYNIQPAKDDTVPGIAARPQGGGPFVFGYLGRLSEEKGIRTLLQATRQLKHADWALHVAGLGEQEFVERLRAEFVDPRIRWMGFMQRDQLFSGLDAMIVPSIWNEPMSYVVLETLSARKGLICSRRGGLPELARLGVDVETYEAEDFRRLAELMDGMMADPERARSSGFADPQSRLCITETTVVGAYEQTYGMRQSIPDAAGATHLL